MAPQDFFPPPRLLADPSDPLHAVRRSWVPVLDARFRRTSNTGAASSPTAIPVMRTAQVECTPGRAYKVRAKGVLIANAVSVVAGFQLLVSGNGGAYNAIETTYRSPPVSGQSDNFQIEGWFFPAAGVLTMQAQLNFWRQSPASGVSTGNTVTLSVNSGASPLDLTIEDCGPDPGSAGTTL